MMEQDEANRPLASLSAATPAVPFGSTMEVPFRPTMELSAYVSAKQQANALRTPRANRPQGITAPQLPASQGNVNCSGVSSIEAGGWRPPDTHGAIGHTHYIQIVNSFIEGYDRNSLVNEIGGASCQPAAPQMRIGLNAFFGYFNQSFFDPRAVYDSTFRRWIVSADAFPESTTVQYLYLAVSKTQNPSEGWWIYRINTKIYATDQTSGFVYDYPQLGFDSSAVYTTASIFNPGYVGTRILQMSKQYLYNGLGIAGCWLVNNDFNIGTMAPPMVQDLRNETWFLTAPNNGSALRVYRFNSLDKACANYIGKVDVPVPAYTVPPAAPQPGTTVTLDTIDNRFVNASAQVGPYLYNIHTIRAGTATPKYYKINVPAAVANPVNGITEQGFVYTTGTSSDFMASMTANSSGSMFVTFTTTDTSRYPTVSFAGKQLADTSFGTVFTRQAFTSPTYYNYTGSRVQRWGDYSAITLDPLAPTTTAWGTGEHVDTATVWGSSIFKMGIP